VQNGDVNSIDSSFVKPKMRILEIKQSLRLLRNSCTPHRASNSHSAYFEKMFAPPSSNSHNASLLSSLLTQRLTPLFTPRLSPLSSLLSAPHQFIHSHNKKPRTTHANKRREDHLQEGKTDG